ncbi:MAG: hypothetical protein J6N20_13830 [Pseudomonas sp.]|nr:hypothetical protein [Pseudomonas sp.]
MPKYFSVVYEVTNETDFVCMAEALKTSMVTGQQVLACAKITACGWGDYATQAEAFQAEIEGEGKDPLDVVANFINDEGLAVDAPGYRDKALAVLGE